jgi:fibronectin type 3 domain-containing protein
MLFASLATGVTADLIFSEDMASGPPSKSVRVALVDPPGPPRNLRADAGDGRVDLYWDPSNSGSPPTGYRIYRGECSGCESRIASILLFTHYGDEGVTNGVTYWYYVTAVLVDGVLDLESGPSNRDSATPGGPPPPPPPTVPGRPKSLNAAPGDEKVDLTWQAPDDNGGSPITNYRIYRGTSQDSLTRHATVGGDARSYADTVVTNGVRYWYQVSAENDVGEGERSNQASATPEAPPSPPGPPVDLRATPGNGSVQLEWSAPTDNGGSPITNYNIYRGTTADQLPFLVQVPPVHSYLDTGLTNGQPYFYRVTAVNAAGQGLPSATVSATPMSGDTAPDPPANLVAVGGDARVSLSWQAPPSNGGSPVTNYNIYRGTSPGGETWLAQVGGEARSHTDGAVMNGVTYHYYVTAVNAIDESGPSNKVSATPNPAPTVPEAARDLTAQRLSGGVRLAWRPPANDGGRPITNYRIYRGTSSMDRSTVTTIGNVTSHMDMGLTNGQRYYYVVVAVNVIGDGPPSNEASAIPATAPSAPRNLRAIPGDGVITIQWSGPQSNGGSPVTNYRIYRGTVSGVLAFVTMVGPIELYTDEGRMNDQTYHYQVTAVNAIDEGPPSNEASTTPRAGQTVPGAPRSLIATAGDNYVRLEWTAPASDGGSPIENYTVYRGTDPDYLPLGMDANQPIFNDSSVDNGVTYYYEVTAWNLRGEGPRSPVARATPRPGPDRASPSVEIIPPRSDEKVTAGERTVYGYATDDTGIERIQVRVNDQDWINAVNTYPWSAVLTLTEGLHTIFAMAEDVAGKTATTNLTITVEPAPGTGPAGGPLGNPGTTMLVLAVGSFAVSAAVAFVILDRRRRFWKNVLGETSSERKLFKDEFFDEPEGGTEHPRHQGNVRDHRLRP